MFHECWICLTQDSHFSFLPNQGRTFDGRDLEQQQTSCEKVSFSSLTPEFHLTPWKMMGDDPFLLGRTVFSGSNLIFWGCIHPYMLHIRPAEKDPRASKLSRRLADNSIHPAVTLEMPPKKHFKQKNIWKNRPSSKEVWKNLSWPENNWMDLLALTCVGLDTGKICAWIFKLQTCGKLSASA